MSSVPQSFLFRYRVPCRRADDATVRAAVARKLAPEALGPAFRVPFWEQNERREKFARSTRGPSKPIPRSPENESRFDFRLGWSPNGLLLTTVVAGRKAVVRRSRAEADEGDSLRLCLDARDVKESRRGNRFCYKFVFFPLVGATDALISPVAQWSPIARAKANPNPVDVEEFALASERRTDGYALSAFIPATAIDGFEPDDFRRFGLHFSVRDDEFGAFDLQHSEWFPVEEDPSLWPSFEMVD